MFHSAGSKRVIGTAFLLCFLFYTVSPLSASVIQNNKRGLWARPAGISLKNIRLFLLDVFVSQFSTQQPDPNEGAPSFTFYLLQKSKIAIQSRKNSHSVNVPMPEGLTPWGHAPARFTVSPFLTFLDVPKAVHGFHLLHSGLSPPPVHISC